MKTKGYQYSYSDELKDDSIVSHVQIEDDKVKASIETKCLICQEHHNIMGLTDEFDLHIKEDILTLTNKAFHVDANKTVHNDTTKDVFKIKYCPFCGRPLNEEGN